MLQTDGLHVQPEVADVPRVLPAGSRAAHDLQMVTVALDVLEQERRQHVPRPVHRRGTNGKSTVTSLLGAIAEASRMTAT